MGNCIQPRFPNNCEVKVPPKEDQEPFPCECFQMVILRAADSAEGEDSRAESHGNLVTLLVL